MCAVLGSTVEHIEKVGSQILITANPAIENSLSLDVLLFHRIYKRGAVLPSL